jgi:hypothetical protein
MKLDEWSLIEKKSLNLKIFDIFKWEIDKKKIYENNYGVCLLHLQQLVRKAF